MEGAGMAMLLDLVQEPTHWQLSVSGDLDYDACSRFRMSVDRIVSSSPQPAVVDLSRLSNIDGAGLGILVGMSHQMASTRSKLVLVTSGEIHGLLTDARLCGVFSTTSSLADAILALQDGATEATNPDELAD